MLQIVFLAFLCGVSLALKTWELPTERPWEHINRDLDLQWMTFKKTYNRTYEAEEELKRRLFWEDTLKFIQEHNLGYEKGEHTYLVGENHLSDLAEDEYEKMLLTGIIMPDPEEEEYPPALTEPDPLVEASFDWSKRGLVSPVKNQGSRCDSSWAFAAIGSLEGQNKKKKGRMVNLSVQNLVDCSRSYGNLGCSGGWANLGFVYIRDNGGVDGERCYPYTARDGYCRFHRSCVQATVSGYQNVGRSEYSLQSTLRRVGPLAIAVDASGRGFASYRSGVYNNPSCNAYDPNHAMLLVGYGRLAGRDFWKVKNSWGIGWGDHGYILMSRNRNNQCGIAYYASYPIV